jgi:extradiol dioxygenase family protein
VFGIEVEVEDWVWTTKKMKVRNISFVVEFCLSFVYNWVDPTTISITKTKPNTP